MLGRGENDRDVLRGGFPSARDIQFLRGTLRELRPLPTRQIARAISDVIVFGRFSGRGRTVEHRSARLRDRIQYHLAGQDRALALAARNDVPVLQDLEHGGGRTLRDMIRFRELVAPVKLSVGLKFSRSETFDDPFCDRHVFGICISA